MHEPWRYNYNDIKGEIERFEMMEKGGKSCYFDVQTIESLFDFFADKFQFEKAERILSIGISQHPSNPSLQSKKAVIYIEKGEDAKAIRLLEALSTIETSNPDLFMNLGFVYLRVKRNEEAVVCFQKAMKLAFEDAEDFLFEIVQYLNGNEQYKYALEFLSKELPKYPNNENLLFEYAFALEKEGRVAEALEAYEKLLEVNPFSENAWYNLGIIHIRKEDYDNAIKCYDLTLAINPAHIEALFNKGNALVAMNKYAEAIDYYIEYLSYGYETTLPYHYIADCHDQIGNIELSLRFYRLTVDSEPMYLPGWLNYLAHLINNDYMEEALEASKKALEYHSDVPEIWYLRARSLLLSDMFKEAAKALHEAFTGEPDNLRNLFELYFVQRKLSPRKDPFKMIEKWLREYPASPAVHYIAAAYYLIDNRQMPMAIKHLKVALAENPLDYELFLELFPTMENMIKKSKRLSALVNDFTPAEY